MICQKNKNIITTQFQSAYSCGCHPLLREHPAATGGSELFCSPRKGEGCCGLQLTGLTRTAGSGPAGTFPWSRVAFVAVQGVGRAQSKDVTQGIWQTGGGYRWAAMLFLKHALKRVLQ